MTPLAHRIVKELALPIKGRTFKDQCGLLRRMDDVHCFEATDILDLAADLAEDLHKRAASAGVLRLMETQTFLPAERTWVEWTRRGMREGVLIEAGIDDAEASLRWSFLGDGMFLSAKRTGALLLRDGMGMNAEWPCARNLESENVEQKRGWIFMLYALLAIINTPRLIGRKQHMPHRGLERKLANAKGLVGKFPLHAWTELKLSVSDIGKRADGTEHEAHYTGEKCLHFCRAHLRIRNGRLERVSAHWRGNPALGIKRTRYKLAA